MNSAVSQTCFHISSGTASVRSDRAMPRYAALSATATRLQNVLVRLSSGRCSIVEKASEMEKVYRLRYRIYIEELKKDLPWADHAQKRLPDPYDSGAIHFAVCRLGGHPVGCARLHLGTAIPKDPLEEMDIVHLVQRDGFRCGYVSKLMVDRSLRGKGASLLILMRAIEYGAAAGAEYGVFHCHPKLCRLYERYGFRRFGKPFEMAHVGIQICMVNLFGDVDHFVKVGSPLAEFVQRFRLPEDRLRALRQSFSLDDN
jgi:predicted GNAT family N-acyltransferase